MKEFIKKHPALADVCDTILSLLCGSFALLAFGIVWILEKLADARQGQEGRWRISVSYTHLTLPTILLV